MLSIEAVGAALLLLLAGQFVRLPQTRNQRIVDAPRLPSPRLVALELGAEELPLFGVLEEPIE